MKAQYNININNYKICPSARRFFDLPNYVWQEKRFWNESRAHKEYRLQAYIHPNITRHHTSRLNPSWHTFKVFLDTQADPYLTEHRMDDLVLFPGSGMLELALVAGHKAFDDSFSYLMDIRFERGLFLPEEGEPLSISLEIDATNGRYWLVSQDNKANAEWVRHSSGLMNYLDKKPDAPAISLADLQRDITDRLPVQPMYNNIKRGGLSYGSVFKTVQNIWTAPGQLLAKIAIPEALKFDLDRYYAHPAMMDTVVHTAFATRRLEGDEELGVYLPVSIDRYYFFQKAQGDIVWSYLKIHQADEKYLHCDVVLFDEAGSIVSQIIGLKLKYITGSRRNEEDIAYSGCYEYRWQPIEAVSTPGLVGSEVLLIADGQDHYRALVDQLKHHGAKVITLGENPTFDWPVDLNDKQLVLKALGEIKNHYPSLKRIVNLLPQNQLGEEELATRIESLVWKCININNAIIEHELQPTLWTINRGSEWAIPQDPPINLVQAPIFGVSRTMNNEYPLAVCKVVDLGDATEDELRILAKMITSADSGSNETELAIRGEQLFGRRLESIDAEQAQAKATQSLRGSGGHYQAMLSIPGIISSLKIRRFTPPALQDHDVEIAIKAATLSDRESIVHSLSQECSGIITRVGTAVSRFKVGDEVMALTPNGVAGVTVVAEHYVARKPVALSFEQAALVPLASLTAWYALMTLARVKAGERVLIHSADTPTGLACIHLAKRANAEIYASASTEGGRSQLRGIGIQHIYDSGTLGFYQQIMADTQGLGVDIVLNNLRGKGAIQSLRCLQSTGRFIELNQQHEGENEALTISCQKSNLSYFTVDIQSFVHQRPNEAAVIFAEATHLIDETALPIYFVISIDELSAALEENSAMGNIVVTMEGIRVDALPAQRLQLAPEKTYLITGGASGLGIVLAKWLADHGARKLALASRSGPKTKEDRLAIERLREQGVEVVLPEVDSPRPKPSAIWSSKSGGLRHWGELFTVRR